MSDPGIGNEAQMRVWFEQVAEAAVETTVLRMRAQQLDGPTAAKHAEAPPIVKWLVGAIAAFGSAALIGLGFWLVTSVSSMRETLARMDERQSGQDVAQLARDSEQDRRITKNEAAISLLSGGGGR